MAPLIELIHFRYQNVSDYSVGHYNVTLSTTTILKHRQIVWCKSYLDILNRLGVNNERDGQTDGRTDGIIAIAKNVRHVACTIQMAAKYDLDAEAEVISWFKQLFDVDLQPGMREMENQLRDGQLLVRYQPTAVMRKIANHNGLSRKSLDSFI